MHLPRSAGVQLHPTSLPGGRLGPEAHAFVDWLADAGQSWWQMLPVGPPDRHGSPYRSRSAFAAWSGLLAEPDAPVTFAEAADFRERHAYWIEDWLALADEDALADQVRFDREWAALRRHAADRGIALIGDVPIYVAPGSADHRGHPELFKPGVQAGVPPDAYSDTGQLWENPIYDWEAMAADGHRWWIERFRRVMDLYDVVRVDHFRAFAAYWEVAEDAETAMTGEWVPGPGAAPFRAAESALGVELPVIAEDLGVITEDVEQLRDELGFPGMVVLQFGFDPADPDSIHHPDRHVAHRLAYTGTHDNDTARGFWDSAPRGVRARVRAALRARRIPLGEDPAWALIALAHDSVARVAMVQAQDVLGLGAEARMNVPGTAGHSWRWRLEHDQLTAEHAARLRAVTEAAGRLDP